MKISADDGIMINQNKSSTPASNDIGIFHTIQESNSTPIAFISAKNLTITASPLSAYSPPRALLVNTTGNYKLYPFSSNIPDAATEIIVNLPLTGYFQGAFNRVLTSAGAELQSVSAIYFVW